MPGSAARFDIDAAIAKIGDIIAGNIGCDGSIAIRDHPHSNVGASGGGGSDGIVANMAFHGGPTTLLCTGSLAAMLTCVRVPFIVLLCTSYLTLAVSFVARSTPFIPGEGVAADIDLADNTRALNIGAQSGAKVVGDRAVLQREACQCTRRTADINTVIGGIFNSCRHS